MDLFIQIVMFGVIIYDMKTIHELKNENTRLRWRLEDYNKSLKQPEEKPK